MIHSLHFTFAPQSLISPTSRARGVKSVRTLLYHKHYYHPSASSIFHTIIKQFNWVLLTKHHQTYSTNCTHLQFHLKRQCLFPHWAIRRSLSICFTWRGLGLGLVSLLMQLYLPRASMSMGRGPTFGNRLGELQRHCDLLKSASRGPIVTSKRLTCTVISPPSLDLW